MRPHKGRVIVWPAYLDSELPRSKGRRIPSNLAAPNVTVDILRAAAVSAGFEVEVEPNKRYPRNWTGNPGYVVVDNPSGHKKKRLLLMLAKGVRRLVAQREAARLAAEKKGSQKQKKGRKGRAGAG